jgi:hypothetical protein
MLGKIPASYKWTGVTNFKRNTLLGSSVIYLLFATKPNDVIETKMSKQYFLFLFYKFAIAIDLYRVLWLQMTGISTHAEIVLQ